MDSQFDIGQATPRAEFRAGESMGLPGKELNMAKKSAAAPKAAEIKDEELAHLHVRGDGFIWQSATGEVTDKKGGDFPALEFALDVRRGAHVITVPHPKAVYDALGLGEAAALHLMKACRDAYTGGKKVGPNAATNRALSVAAKFIASKGPRPSLPKRSADWLTVARTAWSDDREVQEREFAALSPERRAKFMQRIKELEEIDLSF